MVSEVGTNLQVLTPSRKRVRAGDLFAMRIPDGRYMFGRVISTEARIGPMKGVILLYFYDRRFWSKEAPQRESLSPQELLVPPMLTNRLGWSKGVFETVAHWELEADEILPVHCFWSYSRRRYYDERGRELPEPTEPVGEYGLHSFRTIDDAISDALGIGRVPEEP
jgi:hypothetical protein